MCKGLEERKNVFTGWATCKEAGVVGQQGAGLEGGLILRAVEPQDGLEQGKVKVKFDGWLPDKTH